MKWLAGSPDLTPCDFLLWGHVRDLLCVVPLPRDIEELKGRIFGAVTCFTADLSQRVWQETVYKINVSSVKKEAYIKSL